MTSSPYLPGTQFQFAWNSTSLGWLKTCPRLYQYSMLLQLRSRAESAHITFGLHYHSAIEHFDHKRAEGLDYEEALASATLKVLTDSFGWESDHNLKNRYNLVRSVVWYLEEFKNDPTKTVILANGKPAVELSFSFEVDNGLILTGHLDRVADFDTGRYIMDKKTTGSTISSYYFDKFELDNQMSLYTFAGQVILKSPIKGVIIDAAQIAVGFTRFERGFTYRTGEQQEAWLFDFYRWTALARQYAEAGYWPMNDTSCDKFGGCAFKQVCSKSPSVRQSLLDSNYVKVDYNPLEIR